MKLKLVLFLAATVAASPSNDWPPKTGVSVGCGTSFDLEDGEFEDVEFENMLGLTGECDVTITAPEGYHLEVACTGLNATANGEDAEDFHGSSPVKIEFYLENEDSQVFCRVELEEKHKDIKKLRGENGVDTNIKEFEAAFNVVEDDEKKRSEILTANEETIKSINANRSRTWIAGVTIMSDKTMEEIQELYTGLPPIPSQEDRDRMSDRAERELLGPLRDESRSALPESVDLTTIGRVSPTKSQGGCISCAAFAAGATIESCMHRVTGILPTDISEQHLLDCAWPEASQGSNICRAAWPVRYHKWIHKTNNGGVANERDYPYAHGGGAFKPGPTQCDPTVRNTNHGAVVTSHQQSWHASEEDIMRLVAAGHSVTTSFLATGAFGSYRGGIYEEEKCKNYRVDGYHGINHAVAIVGYGVENGVKFWKFKNSWGTWWGENGFGKIVRGGGHCGFAMEFSVPFCSASSEPVTTPAPSPDGACGGIMKETTGTIQSEGFPKAYKNDQNCTWIIQPKGAELDQVIEFTVESLNIEEDSKSGCSFDYLKFINSPISRKLCGKTLPNPIFSTDVLPRQENIRDKGWGNCGAGWYDVQGQGVKNDYCRWVGNCGCRNSNGNDCSWWSCALAGSNEANSPKGQFTEPGPDICQNRVGNGADYVGKASKTVSGRTCQNWSSQTPQAHGLGRVGDHNYCRNPDGEPGVWCYTTDPNKRWELCDVPICGDPVESTCPEGHTPYGNGSDIHCYFPSFKDGEEAAGFKTWLEARDYCREFSKKYPEYTYDLLSLQNTDEYNFILNNDWSEVYKEWKAYFGIWVGLNDRDEEGKWTWSDGAPLEYANPNPTAQTPPWRKGEPSQPYGDEDCVRTYGFEGLTDRECEDKNNFICEGRKVSGPSTRIQFVTDGTGVDKGFKITYKLLTKESCKNQKRATNIGVAPVIFNSPNYPREYGNDESCDWTITVPEGYKVNLMFDDFETELGHDKVIVYDGEGTDSPELKVLDGPNIPEQVKSSGNKMTVTFTTDGTGTKKGFKAAASATDL